MGSPLPSLAALQAYHGVARTGLNRQFSDPLGLLTTGKRADSNYTQVSVVTEWTSKYNSGSVNLSQGGSTFGVGALNSTGYDRYRSGGEFYIPYIGTWGLASTDVYGDHVFLGGLPYPGSGVAIESPADLGINILSEPQHHYPDKYLLPTQHTHSKRANQPSEMLTGDWCMITPEGNYIGCYRGGINLVGSGYWSEVVTSRIDQMVRIRSKTFEHFDSLGERRSYNDEGELNQEWLLCDEQAESFGKKRFAYSKAITDATGGPKGAVAKKLEEAAQVGAWRLQAHVGYLGDLLHIVFTKPQDQEYNAKCPRPKDPGLNPTDSGTEPDTAGLGVAELFIGSDGSVVSRSVREILSEKVAHIRVPLKKREAHDPEGDTSKNGYKRADKKPFEWDKSNPGGAHLQENEFRHWEVDHDEMYRFRGHERDWKVKQRKQSQGPKPEAGEEPYQPGISVVHQRNDGSIYVQDHWGSSLQFADGDITIAPVRDLMLQPGRDCTMITPRDAVIKAKKYVDVTSSEKEVRIKSHLATYIYAKYSGILLETQASQSQKPPVDDTDPDYSAPVKGAKIEGEQYNYASGGSSAGSEASKFFYGIRLHLRNKEASIELHADKDTCPILIQTEGKNSPIVTRSRGENSDIGLETERITSPITAESAGGVNLLTLMNSDIVLKSSKNVINLVSDVFGVSAQRVEIVGTQSVHIWGPNVESILRHTHPPGSADPPPSHKHVMESIANVPLPNPVEVPSLDPALKDFKFDYRHNYAIGKKIYYTYWQSVKNAGKYWKQKKDGEVEEDTYPGKDFKYTQYTPAQEGVKIGATPKDDKYTKGTFEAKSADYPMVDVQKEYNEEQAG